MHGSSKIGSHSQSDRWPQDAVDLTLRQLASVVSISHMPAGNWYHDTSAVPQTMRSMSTNHNRQRTGRGSSSSK